MRSHAGDVYRLAYRLSGNRDEADDLTQETFAEACRSIGSLRDESAARAWLLQILRHRFAHAKRSQRNRLRVVSDEESPEPMAAAPDILERLSNQEELQHALSALPDTYRQAFLLVFLSGFTCAEASKLLAVPLGTVLSRVHRARQRLRQVLGQAMVQDGPTAKGVENRR